MHLSTQNAVRRAQERLVYLGRYFLLCFESVALLAVIFNKKPVPMFTQVRRAQYAVRRRKAFLFVYIDEQVLLQVKNIKNNSTMYVTFTEIR